MNYNKGLFVWTPYLLNIFFTHEKHKSRRHAQGTREVAQRWRELDALPDNLGLIPSTHRVIHNHL